MLGEFPNRSVAVDGDINCRAIFGSHLEGIVKVEVEDVGIRLDIDNQDDYERLRRFDRSISQKTALIEAATHVGLVANRKRGQEILRGLERKGESPERLDTVHVSAGLNIGAESPEKRALSIMAEIVSRIGRKAAG